MSGRLTLRVWLVVSTVGIVAGAILNWSGAHDGAHVAWAVERADGGRGFGFSGGHFKQGWGNDDQRKLVLNAILHGL